MELLLELNGFDLATPDAEIVSVWTSLAESSVTEAELAEWLGAPLHARSIGFALGRLHAVADRIDPIRRLARPALA